MINKMLMSLGDIMNYATKNQKIHDLLWIEYIEKKNISRQELKDAVAEIINQGGLNNNDEDIILSNERIKDSKSKKDIDYFINPVLIPRDLYDFYSKDNEEELTKIFTAKCMYSALYVLCKLKNDEGIVRGVTINKMAQILNYSHSKRLNDGLQRLENENIISIDKTTRPYTYTLNYKATKGFFIVPEEFMVDIKNLKLKKLRLSWHMFWHNHHVPSNKSKMDFKLDTLKNVVNGNSFKEINKLAAELKNKVFSVITNVTSTINKGTNKLKVIFADNNLGIIKLNNEDINLLENSEFYKPITNILDNLNINKNLERIYKVYLKAEKFGVEILNKTEKYSENKSIKSNKDSISYLNKIFELIAKKQIIV